MERCNLELGLKDLERFADSVMPAGLSPCSSMNIAWLNRLPGYYMFLTSTRDELDEAWQLATSCLRNYTTLVYIRAHLVKKLTSSLTSFT